MIPQSAGPENTINKKNSNSNLNLTKDNKMNDSALLITPNKRKSVNKKKQGEGASMSGFSQNLEVVGGNTKKNKSKVVVKRKRGDQSKHRNP
jgi:hypothetical protein